MTDDDLIRRGDAFAVVKGLSLLEGDILALPAVTVTAPDDPTLEEIVVVLSGWIDRLIRERVDLRQKLAALEPAALAPTDAAQAREAALLEAAAVADEHTFGGPAVRDAILALIGEAKPTLGQCECGMTGPCMWDQCKHSLTREART